MQLIVSTSYSQSFINQVKLIEPNLISLKPIDIFKNFAFGLAKSKLVTIYYYHDDLDTADEIVNTLMKKSIQADMNLVKEIAEKDNQLVKQLSKEINREAILSVKQNENIDIKVVKYYQQNIDL